MPANGDGFRLALPLPDMDSGGAHQSICISTASYCDRTGEAIMAALRKVPPNAYRVRVRQDEFVPFPGSEALDQDRVVDLSRICSVRIADLGLKNGRFKTEVVQRVKKALPRQFQYEGPWKVRGDVWTLTSDAPLRSVVLVMNDIALQNDDAVQYTGMGIEDGILDEKLLMVDAQWLDEHVGQLDQDAQRLLTDSLGRAFGTSAN